MILSAAAHEVLAYIQGIAVPEGLTPWEAGRRFYEQFIPLAGAPEAVSQIEEQNIPEDGHSIRLRIYRSGDTDKQPAVIYLHGGWFNAGSLETHDRPLRQLANRMQVTILAVDYRLAPEHPFPAGLNDCERATQWILDNASLLRIDADRIAIAGDSAGGALAATLTRKFREQLIAQLLIYPVTDNALKTPSWMAFRDGPLLDMEGGIQAWSWYLPTGADHSNPDAIPLLAYDLDALPPTFIAVAEYDPLKDEAIQYAEKLKAHGVTVQRNVYKGMIHGFFQMGGVIGYATKLMQDMAAFFKTYSTTQ